MGKAIINSNLGEGQYNVTLKYGKGRIDALIAKLTLEIADLTQRLIAVEPRLTAANEVLQTAADAADAVVATLKFPLTKEMQSAWKTAQADLLTAQKGYQLVLSEKQYLQLRKVNREERLTTFQGITTEVTLDAWCADYTDNMAAGTVGTIEVGRTAQAAPIIYPGNGAAEAAYSATRDGEIVPTLGTTAASALHSYALIPGADKWKPRYRTGVIATIDGDNCTVTLDALVETPKNLSVNQTATVAATIQYMSCNGLVFGEGDAVVVAFTEQNWANPKVIGFVREPKQCESLQIFIRYVTDYGLYTTTDWRMLTVNPSTLDEISLVTRSSISGRRGIAYYPWLKNGICYFLSTTNSEGEGETPKAYQVFGGAGFAGGLDHVPTSPFINFTYYPGRTTAVVANGSVIRTSVVVSDVNVPELIGAQQDYLRIADHDAAGNLIRKSYIDTRSGYESIGGALIVNDMVGNSSATMVCYTSRAYNPYVVPQINEQIEKIKILDASLNIVYSENVVTTTLAPSYLPPKVTAICADKNGFYVLNRQTNTIRKFSNGGDAVASYTFAERTPPTPPADWTGTIINLARYIATTESRIFIITFHGYSRHDFAVIKLHAVAQIVVDRYYVDGANLVFEASNTHYEYADLLYDASDNNVYFPGIYYNYNHAVRVG